MVYVFKISVRIEESVKLSATLKSLRKQESRERRQDVIPAEAGIQRKKRKYFSIGWIPASAGMTKRQE